MSVPDSLFRGLSIVHKCDRLHYVKNVLLSDS